MATALEVIFWCRSNYLGPTWAPHSVRAGRELCGAALVSC